jgi:hypothetical protein
MNYQLHALQEEEEDKKARRKRDKLKSALTRPLGPADPQHKGTSLHMRLTYRECSEEQVRPSQQGLQDQVWLLSSGLWGPGF